MGKTVDGLRSSQMRKLLKNCSNGVAMEVERMNSQHIHDSERMSSHHLHDSERMGSHHLHDSERMGSHHLHDSERMSSHHSVLVHGASLQDMTLVTSRHDDDSMISPSLHSNSPPLPSNKALSLTTSMSLPTNSHRQTDV